VTQKEVHQVNTSVQRVKTYEQKINLFAFAWKFQRKPVVHIGFTLLRTHTYTLCTVVTLYAPV